MKGHFITTAEKHNSMRHNDLLLGEKVQSVVRLEDNQSRDVRETLGIYELLVLRGPGAILLEGLDNKYTRFCQELGKLSSLRNIPRISIRNQNRNNISELIFSLCKICAPQKSLNYRLDFPEELQKVAILNLSDIKAQFEFQNWSVRLYKTKNKTKQTPKPTNHKHNKVSTE